MAIKVVFYAALEPLQKPTFAAQRNNNQKHQHHYKWVK